MTDDDESYRTDGGHPSWGVNPRIGKTTDTEANKIAEETYQNITGNPVQSSTQLIPMAKQGPNLIQCKTCIFDGRRECIEHGYPDDCIKQSCEFKIGILAVIDPIEAQMRNREHDRAIEQAARDDERKRYACNLETIRPPKDCFSHFEGYNSIKCKGCSQWGYCADITVRCTAAREDEQRKWRDEHPGDLVWMTPEEEEARMRGDEREKVLEKKSKLIRDVISKDQSGLAEALAKIRTLAKGYDWIPAGEWGSYDYTRHTVETLQKECGYLLAEVEKISDEGLRDSGNRVTAHIRACEEAIHNPATPAVKDRNSMIPEETEEELKNPTVRELAKKMEDVLLEEMHYTKDGKWSFGLSGDKVKIFYCALIHAFRSQGGVNFLTTAVEYKTIKYEITIRNLRGEDSPAEKLERQAKEIESLKLELKQALGEK